MNTETTAIRARAIRRQESRLWYLRAMLAGGAGNLPALARALYLRARTNGGK